MSGSTERNVIIYDEVSIARLKTADFFKELFIKIHHAGSKREIIHTLSSSEKKMDLIIFNDSFENDRGFELLSEIKEHSSEIPILILTTNDKKEIFFKIISEGICDYLLKPFSEKIFLAKTLEILNFNKTNISPSKKKIHIDNEIAFDIVDYLRSELKKAEKGNFEVSVLMLKFFIPAKENSIKNQDKYIYVSDLFLEKLTELLWDTDIVERTELNNFVGIFPFCGINNISKVYEKIIDCFDEMKKSDKNLFHFHLVLTSLTYPSKKGSAEDLLDSLENSIKQEMENINGLLIKFI